MRSAAIRLALSRTLLASAVLTASVVVGFSAPSYGEVAGFYRAPVDDPVVDPYRVPSGPFGPGNRGIDYDTSPGEEVHASAGGVVSFAGQIGPTWHLVILHDDGIRTSYSFLTSLLKRRGDQVVQGDVVGIAGEQIHFGARAGDSYIDPSILFENSVVDVSLIPTEQRRVQGENQERRGLLRQLGGRIFGQLSGAGAAAGNTIEWMRQTSGEVVGNVVTLSQWVAQVGWAYAYGELMNTALQIRLAAYYWEQFYSPKTMLYLAEQFRRSRRFIQSQSNCTSPRTRVPPSRKRRIMVMVNGIESAGGRGPLQSLNASSLGYRDADVVEFSYRGDQAIDPESGAVITPSHYSPRDTEGDIRESAEKLRDLLIDINAANPGVPLDIVAHSQGGIVARLALDNGQPGSLAAPAPEAANLVMLATPNHGSDLATANAFLGTTGVGGVAQEAIAIGTGAPDPDSRAVAQLSEASALIGHLDKSILPASTRVTSIAAEGDLIVGALNSSLKGATNVLVPLYGLEAHSGIVSSPDTRREVALALAGMGPTCRNVVMGALLGGAISWTTDSLAGGLGAAAIRFDLRGPAQLRAPVQLFDTLNDLSAAVQH